MSELAELLPYDVDDIKHVTLAFSKSVYDDGYDWVIRVTHNNGVRGYALRRYKIGIEAEVALFNLNKYIDAVRKLTT